ncbi:hypothetical protein OPV22_008393 [Ensete ventricosum]|uniref:Uncharacterized protein n=1 Tax=Ensete ventricosum TaxID=4639 RepID=A0AAV8RCM8_ENSVE|nr:hypothetical protein OPV22_008393 [Ensete ventricosum]
MKKRVMRDGGLMVVTHGMEIKPPSVSVVGWECNRIKYTSTEEEVQESGRRTKAVLLCLWFVQKNENVYLELSGYEREEEEQVRCHSIIERFTFLTLLTG